MVKGRRAEVRVSTLSAEQRRELVEGERQGTQYICQVFCGRGAIASRDLTVCPDENALGCDVQEWSIEGTVGSARFYGPKT